MSSSNKYSSSVIDPSVSTRTDTIASIPAVTAAAAKRPTNKEPSPAFIER